MVQVLFGISYYFDQGQYLVRIHHHASCADVVSGNGQVEANLGTCGSLLLPTCRHITIFATQRPLPNVSGVFGLVLWRSVYRAMNWFVYVCIVMV